MSIRNELLEQIAGATFDIRNNASIAGYGSIGIDNDVAVGTINSTPKLIAGFDTELLTPKGVDHVLADDAMRFNYGGVWSFSIKVVMMFDELNAGRRIYFQIYNPDKSVFGDKFYYFVGRNTDGVNMNVTVPVDISDNNVGDRGQLYIGSDSDTFTNAVNIGTTYSVTCNAPVTELVL
ncbi:hypothetical protein NVP1266O_08 [Vibrio phage 1.266.O._10N.286.52.F9]|nr:hypothetical protein NVP1266O_08 [Vibrio phage 1.266.O._10N.286.52.F9]